MGEKLRKVKALVVEFSADCAAIRAVVLRRWTLGERVFMLLSYSKHE